jgi:lipopolysaccharide transport system permease protein
VPKGLRPVFDLNPLTVLIEGYHSAILYGKFPEPASIAFLAVFSGIIMVLGIGIFRRLKKGFADVL